MTKHLPEKSAPGTGRTDPCCRRRSEQVLSGLGGVHETPAAVQYAHRHLDAPTPCSCGQKSFPVCGSPLPRIARRALFSVSWRELYKNDAVVAAALFTPYSDRERAMLDVQSSPASSRAQLPFRPLTSIVGTTSPKISEKPSRSGASAVWVHFATSLQPIFGTGPRVAAA